MSWLRNKTGAKTSRETVPLTLIFHKKISKIVLLIWNKRTRSFLNIINKAREGDVIVYFVHEHVCRWWKTEEQSATLFFLFIYLGHISCASLFDIKQTDGMGETTLPTTTTSKKKSVSKVQWWAHLLEFSYSLFPPVYGGINNSTAE